MARKVPRLQHGALPKQPRSSKDPHQPMSISLSRYQPADLREDTFEKTTDAYMYDVILTHFEQDKEFWESWGVVDCMASVPDKSQKQACRHCGRAYDSLKQDVCQHCKERREMGRAPIRVVMDMEAMSELPRSYPPIVPGRGKPKMVPGLPVGYSVPLEAFTIEDGQRLLERQKLFNDGKIDPRYQWLEDIISKYLKSPEGRARVEPKPKKKASSVRSFMSSFFGAQTAEGPPPLSGVQREDPFEKGQTSKTVIARNGLVSTYTNEKLASGPFRPAPRKGEASESADDPEGDDLDQQLKDLLARTCAKPIPVE